MVGVLIYLDQADLLDIADGKAADLQDLEHTVSSTGATLQVSIAHLMDLASADAQSCERWLHAVSRFPNVEFSIEPGQGMACDRSALAGHLATMRPMFGALRALGEWTERADRQRFEAHANHPAPRPTRRQIETVVDVVLGQRGVEEVATSPAAHTAAASLAGVFRNAVNVLGLGRAVLVDALTVTVPQARERGNLSMLVEVQRRDDRRRRAQSSDFTDELHVTFGACANVLTVDSNVRHILSAIEGRSVPTPAGRDSRRGAIHVVEVRHLAKVAAVVRALAPKTSDSSEEPR